MALPPKVALFVREYLVSLNGADAARRAGYSEKTARSIAYALLQRPDVAEIIRTERTAREALMDMSRERYIRELHAIAVLDPRAIHDWGPDGITVKPSTILTAAEASTIAEVSYTVGAGGTTTRIRPYDKLAAIRLIKDLMGYGAAPTDDGDAAALKAIADDPDPDVLP